MKWIKHAGIRALKTMAQTALGMGAAHAVYIVDVHWSAILSAAVMAGVVSLLMSMAGLPELDGDGK